MKQEIHRIARAYAWLVKLYPGKFRARFEQEMVALFSELLYEATPKGLPALLVVCFRELWNLPVNLIEAHVSHRRGGHSPMFGFELNHASLHDARWGALGFGIGFACITLFRALMQVAGLNQIGDFFSFWVLGLGIIVYGIAGGLGGAVLGIANAWTADSPQNLKQQNRAGRYALAGFVAFGFGWFAPTIFVPILFPSSTASGQITTFFVFEHILKPVVMGALVAALIGLTEFGRSSSLRLCVSGAFAFALGHFAGLVAGPLLLIIGTLLESWFGYRTGTFPSGGMLLMIGILINLVTGIVSGAILGLVLGVLKTQTPLQLTG